MCSWQNAAYFQRIRRFRHRSFNICYGRLHSNAWNRRIETKQCSSESFSDPKALAYIVALTGLVSDHNEDEAHAAGVIARKSSQQIYDKFIEYDERDGFVGMDMRRKFLQMVHFLTTSFSLEAGMTRAKRYANHAGGKKYDRTAGKELEKSGGHEGAEEKLEASLIFREVWENTKNMRDMLRRRRGL